MCEVYWLKNHKIEDFWEWEGILRVDGWWSDWLEGDWWVLRGVWWLEHREFCEIISGFWHLQR